LRLGLTDLEGEIKPMPQSRLVLYAHGSEDPRWRQPFERLTRDLQQQLGAERVRLAYMEFAEPTLMQVAAASSQEGALRLVILPVFMAAGAHLANDLPEQAAAVRAKYGDVEVKVLPPAGEDPRVFDLLHVIAREALEREDT
jgi:sirohydrochlorin cobaltochelatase